MPRGGRRAGQPGKQDYSNRTDLALGNRTAPVVKIPGQTYGEQAGQVAAQQTVPSAPPALPTPAPAPSAAPMQVAPPDIMGRLTAPTERPGEPFQTGLPSGPGPGPEALGGDHVATLAQTLDSLAASSPAVAQLAAYVNSGRL